jgi:UPF0755 protein
MRKMLLSVAAGIVVIAVAGALWVAGQLHQTYQGFQQPVLVEFAHGTSTREMAKVLAREGVIRDQWLFLAARGLARGAKLQAGEYMFDKAASPVEVLGRIARGDIHYLEFVVPEGFNIFDISDAVGKVGLSSEAFLKAARNPAPMRDLDPKAQTLEGYLFPDSYRVYKHTTAEQLCLTMVAQFRMRWKGLKSEVSVHDAVTLASLVEREAKRPEERPVIASVFSNRLRIGMKLDCDPTTVYAALLDNRYKGTIHRSDLANDSLWNTYQHAGLPPGPIANPGLSAIRAALEPAESQYLYFVAKADGSGGHAFSESLAQHAAAVAQYRRATSH